MKIVCYSPMGRGLFTGKYESLKDFDKDDERRGIPMFSEENFPRLMGWVKRVRSFLPFSTLRSWGLDLMIWRGV